MAPEKMRIPWKVLEEMDLDVYTVCNNVAAELENSYDKPTLELLPSSNIVKKHSNLQVFLLLKKELHLLYDSICRPSIVSDLMPSYLNLLLKKNLLSVKNFIEINQGSLITRLKDWLKQFKDHFRGCERCQLKGRICGGCGDPGQKVFYFEIGTTRICKRCKAIYHKTCWAVKGCYTCERQ